ncbi:tape measure protein [Robertmurraya massiliosenegalensis]|uniref:tape measure protein n=1 Tax=Robertmurraya TaxID=2837507 RepID=UPI0039A718B7
MATIRTAIQVYDGMSPAFRSMNNAMHIILNSFENLQNASRNAVDTSSIQTARQELTRAESVFNNIIQNINGAAQSQQNLNNNINRGTSAASGLLSKLIAIASTYLGIQAGGNILALSDELTNTTARLNLMNDGLQTTAELQGMIFQSAQRSYGSYSRTADLIAKLGMNAKDAFASNAEAIHFGELLNKQFAIAGTNAEGISSATLQLTQALGSGVLRGEELNSVFEQAPNIIHTIADYLEVPIGKIREMAAEGLLSADVVKKAMFAATDEINDKFKSMPLTFSQLWTSFKNDALMSFQPVLQKLNEIANNDKFQQVVQNVSASLTTLAGVIMWVLSLISSIGGFFYDNWGIISPIIWGIVAVFAIYTGILLVHKTALMLTAAWQAILTIRTSAQAAAAMLATGATFAQTVAQHGLNAALLASPITKIIFAIIIFVVVIYAAVGALNKFAGTSISATGVIAGAFMTALAFIGNLFVGLWNLLVDVSASIWNIFATVAEFLANVFVDPLGSIVRLFAGMADSVLGILEGIASAIDAVFGFNLASAVNGWRSGLNGKVIDLVGEAKIKMNRMDSSNLKLDRFEYGKAFDSGYSWGKGVEDKLGGAFKMGDILGKAGSLESLGALGSLDGLDKSGKDTAANTAKMADSMDIAEEDLKYLRDLAEQEVVNRFTTAEIKVEMTNHNQINNEMDLDGVVTYLEEKVNEAMEISAEGDHD